MKILIIGQGGREHALAWKAAQSPLTEKVWVAPGNAGTALEEKISNINIEANDIPQLINFVKKESIDLTIVGPEVALAAGVVNSFNQNNLLCFGPTKEAARLETSKAFCKDFLHQHRIPTADYAIFTKEKEALEYLETQKFPIVIKADGLAAGKGVVIAENIHDAKQAVKDILTTNLFGSAGNRIVIEEFLTGFELSYIVVTDGVHILPLASSQDHKRLKDFDLGPNTGGMGAYSPAPQLSLPLENRILSEIIEPVIQGLKTEGIPYIGFLYAGLMIDNNQPKVLEFNCRLGDPEAQPILIRLKNDLVDLCMKTLNKQLNSVQAKWDERPALTVVMTAGGYPQDYKRGDIIQGLEKTEDPDCKVFHAGTKKIGNNIVTDGGRVLSVTVLGDNFIEAQQKAYSIINTIDWPLAHYRHDIGQQAINFLNTKAISSGSEFLL